MYGNLHFLPPCSGTRKGNGEPETDNASMAPGANKYAVDNYKEETPSLFRKGSLYQIISPIYNIYRITRRTYI
jgi:hypothetical protein